MRFFIGKEDRKDPKVQVALQAMREISPDLRRLVFAETNCEEEFNDFMESRRLKQSTSGNFMRILEKVEFGKPPNDDHGVLFNRNGKAHTYVSQPYQIGLSAAKEMVEFAEKHGLEFNISTYPAWHFPAGVISVVWRRL